MHPTAGAAAAARLRRLALRLLLLRTLALLRADADARRVAVRDLLPALLHAATALGGALRRLTVAAVWAQCRCAPCSRRPSQRLLPGRPEARAGADRLRWTTWASRPPMQCWRVRPRCPASAWAACVRSALSWAAPRRLQSCCAPAWCAAARPSSQNTKRRALLCSRRPHVLSLWQAREDAATRKAAFDALQNALPRQEAARPPWSHFVALWKLLQQFPLHIVQEPFAQQMQQLRAGAPSGPANGCANAPQVLQYTSGAAVPESCWCRAHAEALPFSVAWEAVLWRVGFLHSNPQVRPSAARCTELMTRALKPPRRLVGPHKISFVAARLLRRCRSTAAPWTEHVSACGGAGGTLDCAQLHVVLPARGALWQRICA